jgi:hypothetical protein
MSVKQESPKGRFMELEEEIIKKYANGLISKKEAMDLIGLKKAAFNSKMRKYGYSSESYFFPGKEKGFPLNSSNSLKLKAASLIT